MTEKEFAVHWTEESSKVLLKSFPEDFIVGLETETMELPQIRLVLGSELFGSYEITDVDGNSLVTSDSLIKAKYILYANKDKPASIEIPKTEEAITSAVKDYEKHLDLVLHTIEKEYKKVFPEGKNFFQISSSIFNTLNLKRY